MDASHRIKVLGFLGAFALTLSQAACGLFKGPSIVEKCATGVTTSARSSTSGGTTMSGQTAFTTFVFPIVSSQNYCGACHSTAKVPLFATTSEASDYSVAQPFVLNDGTGGFANITQSPLYIYGVGSQNAHCGQSNCETAGAAGLGTALQNWALAEQGKPVPTSGSSTTCALPTGPVADSLGFTPIGKPVSVATGIVDNNGNPLSTGLPLVSIQPEPSPAPTPTYIAFPLSSAGAPAGATLYFQIGYADLPQPTATPSVLGSYILKNPTIVTSQPFNLNGIDITLVNGTNQQPILQEWVAQSGDVPISTKFPGYSVSAALGQVGMLGFTGDTFVVGTKGISTTLSGTYINSEGTQPESTVPSN